MNNTVFNGPIVGCRKAQITKVDAITDDSPYKLVAKYWSLDGKFLFEQILER